MRFLPYDDTRKIRSRIRFGYHWLYLRNNQRSLRFIRRVDTTPKGVSSPTESSNCPVWTRSWNRRASSSSAPARELVVSLAEAPPCPSSESGFEAQSSGCCKARIVYEKSGGVTSETNHGKDFGLKNKVSHPPVPTLSGPERGAYWKTTLSIPRMVMRNSPKMRSV